MYPPYLCGVAVLCLYYVSSRCSAPPVAALAESWLRRVSPASPTNQFNTRVSSLEVELETAEQQLTERCRADIPRRQTDLERLVLDHKTWENRLEVGGGPRSLLTGRRTGQLPGAQCRTLWSRLVC